MKEPKQTHLRRSIEKRTAIAERAAKVAKNPSTPWLLGRIAALEGWRQRPRPFELKVADRLDAMDERARKSDQDSHERLIGALGELRRVRAGEPRKVPQSNEVIGFAHQQEMTQLEQKAAQPPEDHEQ